MRALHGGVFGLALANGFAAADVAITMGLDLPWFTVAWCAVAAAYALAAAWRMPTTGTMSRE